MNSKKKDIKRGIEKFLKKYKLEDQENVKIGFMDENEGIGKLEYIKTGVIPLDLATGGLCKGKINVIYGPKDSCKSTTVRNTISTLQKNDKNFYATYMNQEKTMDRGYWEAGGVDMDRLVGGEVQTNEQALDFVNKCAEGEIPIDLLAIDTVQALASEGELFKNDEVKSVASNTIALIPRLYSQFLRTYTSLNTGKLTLLLVSQVRTQGIGTVRVFDDMTGGNAIKHYTVNILKIEKAGKSNWPNLEVPPNSFPVRFKVDKIKSLGRYSGTQVMGYFYNGSFDKRFNTIYIGKDIGLHDGKSWKWKDKKGQEHEETFKGVNEMFSKLSTEAEDDMFSRLESAYLAKIHGHKEEIPSEVVE